MYRDHIRTTQTFINGLFHFLCATYSATAVNALVLEALKLLFWSFAGVHFRPQKPRLVYLKVKCFPTLMVALTQPFTVGSPNEEIVLVIGRESSLYFVLLAVYFVRLFCVYCVFVYNRPLK